MSPATKSWTVDKSVLSPVFFSDPGNGVEEDGIQIAPLHELVEIAVGIVSIPFEEILIDLLDENANPVEAAVYPHGPKFRIASRVSSSLVCVKREGLPKIGAVGALRIHVDLADRGHLLVDVEAIPFVEVEFLGTPIGSPAALTDKNVVVKLPAKEDRGARTTACIGGRLTLGEPLENWHWRSHDRILGNRSKVLGRLIGTGPVEKYGCPPEIFIRVRSAHEPANHVAGPEGRGGNTRRIESPGRCHRNGPFATEVDPIGEADGRNGGQARLDICRDHDVL